MSFSERYGYKPVREIIQIDSIDEPLRNGIWSLLKVYCWDHTRYSLSQNVKISKEPLDSANKGEIFEKLYIKVRVAESGKCERCWNYREEVGKIEKYPTLCGRCAKVIEQHEVQE